jgi:hypothetical protein
VEKEHFTLSPAGRGKGGGDFEKAVQLRAKKKPGDEKIWAECSIHNRNKIPGAPRKFNYLFDFNGL